MLTVHIIEHLISTTPQLNNVVIFSIKAIKILILNYTYGSVNLKHFLLGFMDTEQRWLYAVYWKNQVH